MSVVLLAACEPAPQTLTLTGGLATGTETASRFLPPEGTQSLSNELDGWVENASYTADLEKRVYLFSLPLWPIGLAGTTPGIRTLALPLPTAAFGTSSTELAPDTGKWAGARAYDIGLCSQHTPWSALARQLAEGLVDELRSKPEQVRSPRLVGVAEAFPILRGSEGTAFDRIGFRMSFFANSIAGDAICVGNNCTTGGCRNTRVALSFKMVLGTTPGAYVRDPAVDRTLQFFGLGAASPEEQDSLLRRLDLCPPVRLEGPIPGANDPRVTIEDLEVSVVASTGCFGGADREKIDASLTNSLHLELADGLAVALRDTLLQRATVFTRGDLPPRACTCDTECTDGASDATNPFGEGSDPRHRCVAGRCNFQLELDRFEVRPEGLEIVLAEDDGDEQAAVLTDPGRLVAAGGLCVGNRSPAVASDEAPRAGLLAPGTFTAPTP